MSETLPPLIHKRIGVAVIRDEKGKILIDRRKSSGEMGGLWEFPGGKIEPPETIEQCIKREVKEELGIDVAVEDLLVEINHTYNTFQVTLFVHNCRYLGGEPQAIECEEILWVNPPEMKNYEFPQANTQIIDLLQTRGGV